MIKVKPEEFRVEEKAFLPLASSGRYGVYTLTKKGLTTEEAVRLIARHFSLPLSSVSWGGRKDKYALTTQYITIFQGPKEGLEEKNIRLQPLGFMERPMGPDLLEGNFFQITLRRLKEIEPVLVATEEVNIFGFPNYFDDQRFRSYDPERGFFAEKILRRHWNGALQVYLTSLTPSMKKREKERRRAFLFNWKNWRRCLELAQKPEEKKIFAALEANPTRPEFALKFIPPEEVSFLYASYQAHLWNECLRRLIRQLNMPHLSVSGREGDYLFWQKLGEAERNYWQALKLPTAGRKPCFQDELSGQLFSELLAEKGLTLSSFRTRVLRLVGFRSFLRPAAAFPKNLKIIEAGDDELYPHWKKITLSFELGRGSYATILVKRLSLQPGNASLSLIDSPAD